jgi:hypothetical protein
MKTTRGGMSDQDSGMGRSWTRAEDRMAIRHRNIRVWDYFLFMGLLSLILLLNIHSS